MIHASFSFVLEYNPSFVILNTSKDSVAPSGLEPLGYLYPGPTPGATFCRRFAARWVVDPKA